MNVAEVDAARPPSMVRAWCALVWFSLRRQARARQMIGIALGLLAVSAAVVAIMTAAGRWNMGHFRSPRGAGPHYREWLEVTTVESKLVTAGSPGGAVTDAVTGAWRAGLDHSGFIVFSRWAPYGLFLSFLLPIWSLSFATEALGADREERTMVWLLTRPLPRWSIYLAKYVALLPWCLGLGVGGFALLCLLAGRPGRLALALDWPAVLAATLAFSSLFHLFSACSRRPAILALVYSFFLEIVLGNLPGTMKRVSIGFYARCIMFDAAERIGVTPERSVVYLPVDPLTAWCMLLLVTIGCLLAGMVVFARSEYVESV